MRDYYQLIEGEARSVESSGPGELASVLDVFDNIIILNPVSYDDRIAR